MTEGGRARLVDLFAAARADRRAVLLPYLTAGLPDLESSVDLFEAMSGAGADGFEVGIPYSDPLIDGPTIHTAGLKALDAGATIERAIEIVAAVTERTGRPTIVMTYVNPVLRYGAKRFASMVAAAGASAVIVADLPADEAEPFKAAFRDAGVGMVLFVAPTTDDKRLATVTSLDPVFLYGLPSSVSPASGKRPQPSEPLCLLPGCAPSAQLPSYSASALQRRNTPGWRHGSPTV